ncbi:MAG TPA: hypothetical protein DCP92_11590 [Nitrospiraceae bacterium]|jgi:hypothetical protein|nr:hypothetical protein [Nitrospiraceae bacterium]
MKRVYDDERGIALVLALILSLVVLVTVSALLYIITQGSAMSGYQKRYETALESGKGGVNIVAGDIMPQFIGQLNTAALTTIETGLLTKYNGATNPFPLTLSFAIPVPNIATTNACLQTKLTMTELTGATNNWTATGGCTAPMESTNIADPNTGLIAADMSFVLPGPGAVSPTNPLNFIVYAKIVDTAVGNTSTTGLDLQGSGVVEAGSGMISPPQVPFMYRIEFQAQRQNNPDEKSQLSILYAY